MANRAFVFWLQGRGKKKPVAVTEDLFVWETEQAKPLAALRAFSQCELAAWPETTQAEQLQLAVNTAVALLATVSVAKNRDARANVRTD
jgi:hypothetical protein